MLKTQLRAKLVVDEIVQEIICNVCGEFKAILGEEDRDLVARNNLHDMSITGGYGTKFPGDLETAKFHVCGECLGAWVRTFAIAPDYTNGWGDPQPSVECFDSETAEERVYQWGWVRPASVSEAEFETWYRETGDLLYDKLKEDEGRVLPTVPILRASSVWRHYKGDLYQVLSMDAYHWRTNERMVLYLGLYGDNPFYIQPLQRWFETVTDGQRRFTPFEVK